MTAFMNSLGLTKTCRRRVCSVEQRRDDVFMDCEASCGTSHLIYNYISSPWSCSRRSSAPMRLNNSRLRASLTSLLRLAFLIHFVCRAMMEGWQWRWHRNHKLCPDGGGEGSNLENSKMAGVIQSPLGKHAQNPMSKMPCLSSVPK